MPKAAFKSRQIEDKILSTTPWTSTNFGHQAEIEIGMPRSRTWDTIAIINSTADVDAEDIAAFIVRVVNDYSKSRGFIKETSPQVKLTPREKEMLLWTAYGKTSLQIAKQFSVSETTVKTHLQSIMRKLPASNKVHAVAIALSEHMIFPVSSSFRRIPKATPSVISVHKNEDN